MSFSVTTHFASLLANLFMSSVSSLATDSYYVGVGAVSPWANSDTQIPTAVDILNQKVMAWRSMFAGKRITGNDVCLVAPRVNWANGVVYTAYTSTGNTDLGNTNFYVLTSDYNVYKCIQNANNAPSTVQPTYVSFSSTNQEIDGYIWKYMYTLTVSDRVRFMTDAWMPVRFLTFNNGSTQWQVQQAAIPGGLNSILVLTGGTGYSNVSNLSVTITGDGTGASAVANLTGNSVSSIRMVSPGSGYTFCNAAIQDVSFTPGTGATLSVIIDPPGGLGSNPVDELEAKDVMINTRIKGSENGVLSVQNDFRQVLLLHNPVDAISGNTYSNTAFSQTMKLTVSPGGGNYSLDEYVFQGPSISNPYFSGKVVDWDQGNNIVQVVETFGTPTAIALIGATSGTQRLSVIAVTNPNLQYFSGRILYFDNTSAIQRAIDQTDDIKIVLQF